MRIERVRGTRDFMPEEMTKRRIIENRMRGIAERWGYEEIKTPTFELAELFTRKSGEEILDEMYDFKDKGGRRLALRPELTAPVIRMYVNELKMAPKPTKVYYFGNCFRYENPQRARFREFWQFGAEIIGSNTPEAQAEIIALCYFILKSLGVNGELRIGHVGPIGEILKNVEEEKRNKAMRLIDKGSREEVVEFLGGIGAKKELIDNLMHLIDLKGKQALGEARKIVASASTSASDNDSLKELERTLEILDYYEVVYTINLGIARGLDYYTGMVFEIYAEEEKLGAQNQICGGGSYRLASLFGGDDTPSTGFAFGFDRLAEICTLEDEELRKKEIVVVPVSVSGDDDDVDANSNTKNVNIKEEAIKIASKLREHFPTYIDVMNRSLSAQLSYANSIHAPFAVIIGKKEVKEKKVTLRNLHTGAQEMMSLEKCIERINAYFLDN
jgi:histidyl-tRNA synthetase